MKLVESINRIKNSDREITVWRAERADYQYTDEKKQELLRVAQENADLSIADLARLLLQQDSDITEVEVTDADGFTKGERSGVRVFRTWLSGL